MTSTGMQKCFLCSSFAASSFSDVVRHIGFIHSHEPNFTVVCGINGCVRSYHQFSSYKKHLYRNDPEVLRTTGTSLPASGDLGDNDLLVELGSDNPHQETGLSDDNNQGEMADVHVFHISARFETFWCHVYLEDI